MSEKEIETTDDDPVAVLQDAQEAILKQIAAQKILISEEKKKLRKIEKQNLEDFPNKIKDREECTVKIRELTEKQIELELDLKSLKRTADDENEEKIQAALFKIKTDWIDQQPTSAYIINDQQFVFIKDYSTVPEKQNIQIEQYEPSRFVELLAKDLGIKSWHLPPPRVKQLFNESGRTFNFSRYSIDPVIWHRNDVYLPIQHMEKYFINNAVLTTEQQEDARTSLDFFDILMYSLSGGKKENQEHIERWILHKIKNYRKAVVTPDLVIVGHVGGNGKGIIQAIIRLMLPAMLSGKANSKTLNSNFNAIMLGKLIVFFDDQNSREIPLEVVKQLAGSETMIFEPKGKDQYEGEKTHSSAWFSNTLPFRLTPAGQEGGVDRRFSIMATNITFLESIRKYYAEEFGQAITVEESKDVAEGIVGKVLLNRINIAAWFRELERRHPEVGDRDYVLKALHGADYYYFLENQRTSFEIIWHDLITPVIQEGGCVPMFVVKELLRLMDNKIVGEKTINTQFKRLSAETKLEIESEKLQIEITPAVTTSKKQCFVFRPKKTADFTNKTFDWNRVSNIPYSIPSFGKDLIAEDNLVFGIKHSFDDEQPTAELEEITNFEPGIGEKSWEEQ